MSTWIGMRATPDVRLTPRDEDPLHVTLFYFPQTVHSDGLKDLCLHILRYSFELCPHESCLTAEVSHWDKFGHYNDVTVAVLKDSFTSKFQIPHLKERLRGFEPSDEFEFVPHISCEKENDALTSAKMDSIFIKSNGKMVMERFF